MLGLSNIRSECAGYQRLGTIMVSVFPSPGRPSLPTTPRHEGEGAKLEHGPRYLHTSQQTTPDTSHSQLSSSHTELPSQQLNYLHIWTEI